MLWSPGDSPYRFGENDTTPHDRTDRVWTTVDNRGTTNRGLTSTKRCSSPIHKPYNNYTKIYLVLRRRPE